MNPITLTHDEYDNMSYEEFKQWCKNYVASKYSSKRNICLDVIDDFDEYKDYRLLVEAITNHNNGGYTIHNYIELRSNIEDMLDYNTIADAFYESLDFAAQDEGGVVYSRIMYDGILGTDLWFVFHPGADDNTHLSEIAYDSEHDKLIITDIF